MSRPLDHATLFKYPLRGWRDFFYLVLEIATYYCGWILCAGARIPLSNPEEGFGNLALSLSQLEMGLHTEFEARLVELATDGLLSPSSSQV